MRSFYADGLSASQISKKFNYTDLYFKKLRYQFNKALKRGKNIFFQKPKTGPKSRFTEPKTIEEIVKLRKQNHSILDIKGILESKDKQISLDTIDQILKTQGFAPLPKRTRQERIMVKVP